MSAREMFLAAAAWLACANAAGASIILLSTHSSDETDPALLSATLDFSVAGNTLTLAVTNDTLGENSFNINQLYFNGGGGVTGLALDSGPSGWGLEFDEHAAGFGTFGFALIGGVGRNVHTVGPGEMVTFIFTIAGPGNPSSCVLLTYHHSLPRQAKSPKIATDVRS